MNWEIIGKATQFIAEEMGISLKRSALSPNIRERMDHSCAVLDEEGRIVAQAEHIPVHLGSFKIGAKNIIDYMNENNIILKDNEMLVTNDPYISGTHLNDVTFMAPVYNKNKLFCYVINKAHNVDVGGPVFGSLNPGAVNIYQEGMIIPPVRGSGDIIKFIISNFKDPDTALGDLNAQMAANRTGIKRIKEILYKYNENDIKNSWDELIYHSRELSLNAISKWPSGEYESEDFLEGNDDLIKLKLKLFINKNGIKADFSGTNKQVNYPLNAVLGVTFSSVSFSIRSAINQEIPTNDGFYSIIDLMVPKGSLLNPERPHPVSGGNVETTQRVADTVLLAMSRFLKEIPAASSGTMMNIMLGGENNGKYWSYYETIGGGNGARFNSNGESGIHSNMTNTLNTPIEIAEREYPVFFTAYKLRRGSGGSGHYNGGDGIIRSFYVKNQTYISVIADRFKVKPWGLHGGSPGKNGIIYIISSGRKKRMPGKFSFKLKANDEVIIKTPGGGGYGNR
ncbi:hydantoinase B/oxoprolinase family protein [Picrophilus oshimae]|uniref:N-methylhydantoinase B n=1 Tax=Picrophilus torridus (strain ATCC 700027 / DSM 9790 / JCM 10055 / NBRC 100828 / KAW 2/3) TaxID=1122961 RepID=A0A8G2FWA6_PICTO|nr:hydantoinase B/oxoprolinase family protein [Picrophilus oshimae]SMD30652.1 N-methylhydantoinase B [Picrophilus oshimae DSM 9789]